MKTQNQSGRFGRVMVAMLAIFTILMASNLGTVHAVPPPDFGARLWFNGARDPLKADGPWATGDIKSCTTTGGASLFKPANQQGWNDVDRICFKFNISPGGVGYFDVWIRMSGPQSTGENCRMRIKGTLREVSRQESTTPATVRYSGTAQVVETYGRELEGWSLTGMTVSATGEFTRDVFETCPETLLFRQDQTIFPGQGACGFQITGKWVPPIIIPVPLRSAPAPQLGSAPMILSAPTTQQIVGTSLDALEAFEAGTATEAEVDEALSNAESLLNLPVGGGDGN